MNYFDCFPFGFKMPLNWSICNLIYSKIKKLSHNSTLREEQRDEEEEEVKGREKNNFSIELKRKERHFMTNVRNSTDKKSFVL